MAQQQYLINNCLFVCVCVRVYRGYFFFTEMERNRRCIARKHIWGHDNSPIAVRVCDVNGYIYSTFSFTWPDTPWWLCLDILIWMCYWIMYAPVGNSIRNSMPSILLLSLSIRYTITSCWPHTVSLLSIFVCLYFYLLITTTLFPFKKKKKITSTKQKNRRRFDLICLALLYLSYLSRELYYHSSLLSFIFLLWSCSGDDGFVFLFSLHIFDSTPQEHNFTYSFSLYLRLGPSPKQKKKQKKKENYVWLFHLIFDLIYYYYFLYFVLACRGSVL